MATPTLRLTALAALLAGCTIEGSRQAGDPCLMARECASPLRCEVTSEGVSRCVPPVRLDLPPPDAAAPDAAAPDAAPDLAPMDAPPDVAPPMDAPREVTPADVPREPTLDAAPDAAPDAIDEARTDLGADDVDDASDDRPREAATD